MRHSIYYTPHPVSDLHQLGSIWLGRDALSGVALTQPDPRLVAITHHPRRYGLHGTLKAPFRLKDAVAVATLENAIRNLASQHESFIVPPLMLADVDGYLALVPSATSTALNDLAEDCVAQLDDFRTPPGEAELRQRRAVGLSDAQEQLLQRWGYPYVMEEFRFHISLTQALTDDERQWVMPLAEQHFAPVLSQPLSIDTITLMLEPEAGEDFRMLECFSLVYNAMKAAS